MKPTSQFNSLNISGLSQELPQGFQSPYILEERQLNVTQMDVFSRLMRDRIIFLGDAITEEVANTVVAQLLFLENTDKGKPIHMYINSPGGSVYDGLAILDTMNFITSPVYTTCVGLAASMASILLAAGEKGHRTALPHSRVMIHQPMGGIHGQASDIQITAKEIQTLKDELYEILSEASGKSVEQIEKDADRDHWMRAKEAVEYGLIDKVRVKTKKQD